MLSGFYCRVLVKNLKRESEDYFTSFCFQYGAQGVFEELEFTQPDVTFNPEIREKPILNINVYFPEQPPEDFFLKLEAEFPGAKPERYLEQNKDWLEEWKKGFEPFMFVDPFWIVPSWRETPKQAKNVVIMDPGMAFGTGTHETTRLAAQLLVVNWPRFHYVPKVIDVGTGTGILSILAEKLGAKRVLGVDNDPEARRVALENIEQNNMQYIEISSGNLEEVDETFDLVIANIIDGVLLTLKEDLLRVLSAKGKVILSGILVEREKNFIEKFLEGTHLKVIQRNQDGEWAAYFLEYDPKNTQKP